MAIVSVTKVFDEERVVRDASGVTIYETYRVEFSTLADDFTTALTAVDPVSSLAVPGGLATRSATVNDSGTPSTGSVPVKSIEIVRRSEKLAVNVVVTYGTLDSSLSFGGGGVNANGNWNVELSVKSVSVDVTQSKDTSNLTIRNSAGEPISPGLPNTKYDREITISGVTRVPRIETSKVLIGKTNSGEVTFSLNGGAVESGVNELKLVDTQFSASSTDKTAWKFAYVFHERQGGWQREFINEGTYYKDADGNHVPAPNGQNVFLDDTGLQLAAGANATLTTTYLDTETDFAPLFATI